MKVELSNTRKIAAQDIRKTHYGRVWTFAYMTGDTEMLFFGRQVCLTGSLADAQKHDTKDTLPYAGAMTPGMFITDRSGLVRMGVLYLDEEGKPSVFVTRHFVRARCPSMIEAEHDEVSDVKEA